MSLGGFDSLLDFVIYQLHNEEFRHVEHKRQQILRDQAERCFNYSSSTSSRGVDVLEEKPKFIGDDNDEEVETTHEMILSPADTYESYATNESGKSPLYESKKIQVRTMNQCPVKDLPIMADSENVTENIHIISSGGGDDDFSEVEDETGARTFEYSSRVSDDIMDQIPSSSSSSNSQPAEDDLMQIDDLTICQTTQQSQHQCSNRQQGDEQQQRKGKKEKYESNHASINMKRVMAAHQATA